MSSAGFGPPRIVRVIAESTSQERRRSDASPTLSLVMATLGRTDPIARFLDSVEVDLSSSVELIIVDQNQDDRVSRLLDGRGLCGRVRVVTSRPGLSLARNVGVAAAGGALLGFPDDDCWYPPRLIDLVIQWFAEHPEAAGLSCRVSDERGRPSAGGYMARDPHWITRGNVWRLSLIHI